MDKIISDKNSITYRFQCDCTSPEDVMDITVDNSNNKKYFSINMYYNEVNFWSRVKESISILKGNWNWREFIVSQGGSEDDDKMISDIFNPDKTFEELP